MKKQAAKRSDVATVLREAALGLPETEEGIACAGTALESRTVKVRGKAFLFLGVTKAMLKLKESLAEATALAARQPAACKVGANGWTNVTVAGEGIEPPPVEMLVRWIGESYRLFASEGPSGPKKSAKRSVKKKPAKKGRGGGAPS